jgi:hypothetical protein
MTKLLEHAMAEVAKLPIDEQDQLAQLVLDTIEDDRRWDQAFASSQDLLSRMANEALEAHRSGAARAIDEDCNLARD